MGQAGYLAERYEYTPYGQRTVYSHGVVLPDITGDGFVGVDDLNIVNINWNKGTPTNDPLVTYPTLQSARQFKLVNLSGIDPGTTLNEVGHQGLFHDEEFGAQGGLIYNRARTLHPKLGRFMQRDLLGYVDGMNLYEVGRSATKNRRDPLGYASSNEDKEEEYPCCVCNDLLILSLGFSENLGKVYTEKTGVEHVGGNLTVGYNSTGTGDPKGCKFERTVKDYVWLTEDGKKSILVKDKEHKPDPLEPEPLTKIVIDGDKWTHVNLDAPGLMVLKSTVPAQKRAVYRYWVTNSDGSITPACDKTWTYTLNIGKDGNVTYSPEHITPPDTPPGTPVPIPPDKPIE